MCCCTVVALLYSRFSHMQLHFAVPAPPRAYWPNTTQVLSAPHETHFVCISQAAPSFCCSSSQSHTSPALLLLVKQQQVVLFLSVTLLALTLRFLHHMGVTRVTLSFGAVREEREREAGRGSGKEEVER